MQAISPHQVIRKGSTFFPLCSTDFSRALHHPDPLSMSVSRVLHVALSAAQPRGLGPSTPQVPAAMVPGNVSPQGLPYSGITLEG